MASAAAGESPKIVLDEKRGRFETEDKEAYLQYRLVDVGSAGTTTATKAMDMVHTYVPGSKRGQGVAALLCGAAFAHARDRSLSVIPTCSYISETFLPRNPSWNRIVYGNQDPKASM